MTKTKITERAEEQFKLYHQWRQQAQPWEHMTDDQKHTWATFNVGNHPSALSRPWRTWGEVGLFLIIFLLLSALYTHCQEITPVTPHGTTTGGGGGAAQLQVRNAGDTAWVNVGFNGANLTLPVTLQTGSATFGAISNTSFNVGNFPAGFNVNNFPATQAVTQSTSPWVVSASGNFGVTQQTSPWVTSCTVANCAVSVNNWAAGVLGAMANYGTSPGAVLVPGVNAFVTNIPHVIVDTVPTTAVTQSGTWTVQPGNTANTTPWKVDGSAVTQPVQGAKTNNNAAPGATNEGSLDGVANAAPPTWTEGNQVGQSVDLAGNLRTYAHPPNVLGCYSANGRTPTYTGLSAAAPLVSFRWGDSTRLGIIERVQINVVTVTAATAGFLTERELIIARGFTASDTGGTALTLTGNNQKRRTSQGTSLVTDFRSGGALTAGTRTLDANPISSLIGYAAANMTGITIGCGGAAATGAAWSCGGGTGMVDMLNAINGQEYPIVLAQNEGFIIRIGKDAEATSAVQQTYFNVTWCEAAAY